MAEGPLQGAAGAVGDKALRGRGRELKLAGTTSWPGSLPPAGAPTPGLLLGNLQRSWVVGGLELGVGEHDPTWLSSWYPGGRGGGYDLRFQTERGDPLPGLTSRSYRLELGGEGRISLPKVPMMHKSER